MLPATMVAIGPPRNLRPLKGEFRLLEKDWLTSYTQSTPLLKMVMSAGAPAATESFAPELTGTDLVARVRERLEASGEGVSLADARVVVSGGAGFLGSHLCGALLARGDEVVCVDNLVTGNEANVAPLVANRSFTFLRHDVSNHVIVDGAVRVPESGAIIDYVVEIPGSLKIGKSMPGTSIPVVEESRLFTDQPDSAIIFSWHIADELAPTLRAKGYRGKLLSPLPAPREI